MLLKLWERILSYCEFDPLAETEANLAALASRPPSVYPSVAVGRPAFQAPASVLDPRQTGYHLDVMVGWNRFYPRWNSLPVAHGLHLKEVMVNCRLVPEFRPSSPGEIVPDEAIPQSLSRFEYGLALMLEDLLVYGPNPEVDLGPPAARYTIGSLTVNLTLDDGWDDDSLREWFKQNMPYELRYLEYGLSSAFAQTMGLVMKWKKTGPHNNYLWAEMRRTSSLSRPQIAPFHSIQTMLRRVQKVDIKADGKTVGGCVLDASHWEKIAYMP